MAQYNNFIIVILSYSGKFSYYGGNFRTFYASVCKWILHGDLIDLTMCIKIKYWYHCYSCFTKSLSSLPRHQYMHVHVHVSNLRPLKWCCMFIINYRFEDCCCIDIVLLLGLSASNNFISVLPSVML